MSNLNACVIPSKIASKENLKAYIAQGVVPASQTDVDLLIDDLYAMGYLNPLVSELNKMPAEYRALKLRCDWVRSANPKSIDGKMGLVEITQDVYDKTPIVKLDENKLIKHVGRLVPFEPVRAYKVDTRDEVTKLAEENSESDEAKAMLEAFKKVTTDEKTDPEPKEDGFEVVPKTNSNGGKKEQRNAIVDDAFGFITKDKTLFDLLTFVRKLIAQAKNAEKKGVILAGGSVFCALTDQWYQCKDYDLFMYGMNENEMKMLFQCIISHFKPKSVKRTRNAVTFDLTSARPIQFILRQYTNMNEILLGFDNDVCAVGFDGEKFWGTETFLFALKNKVNVVDLELAGSVYESRLTKYAQRGIDIFVPSFDQKKVNVTGVMAGYEKKAVNKGLSWILAACVFKSPKKGMAESGYEGGDVVYMPVGGSGIFDDQGIDCNRAGWSGRQLLMVPSYDPQTVKAMGVMVPHCTSIKQLDVGEYPKFPSTIKFVTIGESGSRFACAFYPVNYKNIHEEWYNGVLYNAA